MRDASKATLNRKKAEYLNEIWAIGAAHARYRENGSWYATLSSFPAALIDAHGYVRFETEQDYLNSPYLQIGKQITVPKRISAIPGYVLVDESDETSRLDPNELLVRLGRRPRKQKAISYVVASLDIL
jgi:hypothetical protein